MGKDSPFGSVSRLKSLRQHIEETGPYTPDTAWQFVYRELMWFDGGNGLAHLYESDKAQPGRSQWYERAVRFTDRLTELLGAGDRAALKAQLDRLFRDCLGKLLAAREEAKRKGEVIEADELDADELGEGDVEAYVPDADLIQEFATILKERAGLGDDEAFGLARRLVSVARHYFTVERKRQNILGEGFEDLLWLLATKVCGVPADRLKLRKKADALPGFSAMHHRTTISKPDMALVTADRTDLLVSVKWSIRQDRQTQWSNELDCYVELMSQEEAPRFLLVTNEYDPGRMINAFGLDRGRLKLDTIIHISLELLEHALSDHPTWPAVKAMIDARRLRSLGQFLDELKALTAVV